MAPNTASIDLTAVHDAAGRFSASAADLDGALQAHPACFGGAVAGRAYLSRGDALRSALDQIAQQIADWARASADIAASLTVTAAGYRDADVRAGARQG